MTTSIFRLGPFPPGLSSFPYTTLFRSKNGNFNLSGKHSATLPAGVYYVNEFFIDSPATLQLEGPVTFRVSGQVTLRGAVETEDRKSTRLNSSHRCISYAVFGLNKEKNM